MSLDLSTGGRAVVAFSFYTGPAGVGGVDQRGTAIIAVPMKTVRAAESRTGESGDIDGRPVEIIRIEKSPVPGYTRVVVRLTN